MIYEEESNCLHYYVGSTANTEGKAHTHTQLDDTVTMRRLADGERERGGSEGRGLSG